MTKLPRKIVAIGSHRASEENLMPIEPHDTRDIDQIKERPGAPTRKLKAEHVVELAMSMSAVGLVEPIAIDRANHLIAGGHRLAAARLLDLDPEEREAFLKKVCGRVGDATLIRAREIAGTGEFDPCKIPVRIFDFDAREDPQRALEAEITENTKRVDYTTKEMYSILELLIEQGYVRNKEPGRPKRGSVGAIRMLSTIVGRTPKHLTRLMNEYEKHLKKKRGERDETTPYEDERKALAAFVRGVKALAWYRVKNRTELAEVKDLGKRVHALPLTKEILKVIEAIENKTIVPTLQITKNIDSVPDEDDED